jgi:hypothetical protein
MSEVLAVKVLVPVGMLGGGFPRTLWNAGLRWAPTSSSLAINRSGTTATAMVQLASGVP